MSTTNWLPKLFKAIDGKDSEAFSQFLADDMVFRFGNAETVTGRKRVVETVYGFFQSIASLRHEILHIWEQGNTVICHGKVTYTRLDGGILSVPFANIFTVKDSLISGYLIFVDISALYGNSGK